MGNNTTHNWSVLIHLYGKYFVMWAIFKMAAFEKITQTGNTPYYTAIEAFFKINNW